MYVLCSVCVLCVLSGLLEVTMQVLTKSEAVKVVKEVSGQDITLVMSIGVQMSAQLGRDYQFLLCDYTVAPFHGKEWACALYKNDQQVLRFNVDPKK